MLGNNLKNKSRRDPVGISSRKLPQVASVEVSEKLEKKMTEIKLNKKEQETQAKAEIMRLPYFDLTSFPISPESIGLIEEEKSIELKMICFIVPSSLSFLFRFQVMLLQFGTHVDIFLSARNNPSIVCAEPS